MGRWLVGRRHRTSQSANDGNVYSLLTRFVYGWTSVFFGIYMQ